MKITISFALIIFLLSFSSCKQDKESEGPTSVHGFILDATSNKSIASADVWLVKAEGSSALSHKVIAYKKSGSDGYYNFDFTAERDKHYYLTTEAQHYYKAEASDFSNGKNTKIDIKPWPKGYIKINLVNEDPKNVATISINVVPDAPLYYQNDTVLFGEAKGNQDREIVWWVKQSTDTNSKKYSATIHALALDTVEHTIKF